MKQFFPNLTTAVRSLRVSARSIILKIFGYDIVTSYPSLS